MPHPRKEPNLKDLLVQVTGRGRLAGAGDVTSVEKHMDYSHRVQRAILRWMYVQSKDGATWERLGDMAAEAANHALPCSSVTAARWMHQLVQRGGPWRLDEVTVTVDGEAEDRFRLVRRPWPEIVRSYRKELRKLGEWDEPEAGAGQDVRDG